MRPRPEITLTESTPVPATEMTMAQCRGDTSMFKLHHLSAVPRFLRHHDSVLHKTLKAIARLCGLHFKSNVCICFKTVH